MLLKFLKRFIQEIFSVKNQNNHKVLTVFGLKIKFKSSKNELRNRINVLDSRINLLLSNQKWQKATGYIRNVQSIDFDMLQVVHNICERHNISYWLEAGTLLGAIRHKGFIPWDDDLDIRMTRDNYDKFLTVWDEIKPVGYELQNKENTPNFPQSFSKIRKNNTTFIQHDWEKGMYNTGIFIDIFPLDRIPKKRLQKNLFLFRSYKYLIYTRESLYSEENGLIRFAISVLMKLTSHKHRMKYRKKYIEYVKKINLDTSLNCIGIEIPSCLNIEYSHDIANEYIEMSFENIKFMCFKKWDEYLGKIYGDYMSLPPENERVWKHHPVLLEF